jgi:hypothetical protein
MGREPWKIVLDAWSLDLVGKIEALSDDALEELVLATAHPTNSNVWWITYHLAPLLRDVAVNEQMMRARKAADAPPPPNEHTKGDH